MTSSKLDAPTVTYRDRFYARRHEATRASALAVLPVVLELLEVRSAVDVGCGVGTWLAVLHEHGVEDVLGIEGDWVATEHLRIPRERFLHHDLRLPIRLDRSFDLAISLEVAEHLPEESAADFVASLTRLAPVVLFSAAVPYQGGQGHLNERWPEFWARRFAAAGFAVADAVRPRVWNNPAVRVWYAQNTLLFVDRERLSTWPALGAAVDETDPERLSIVHPRLYERNSDPRNLSLRQVVPVIPGILARSARLAWRRLRSVGR